MSSAPSPEEIYARAKSEGQRRLDMPPLEQVATGFIAGVTIVFGIVAHAVTVAHLEPDLGAGVAQVVGAVAFAIGLVFLVMGRSELFSENLFDPVAAAVDEPGRGVWLRLARLWLVILVLNLVGGAVLLGVLMVDGALPSASGEALAATAREIVGKEWTGTLARAVLAGALITLLSYLLNASNTASARIMVTLMVGFFLAIGPFDHVVVSALNVLFGIWWTADVGIADLAANIGLSAVGNLAGGLLLVTFTHTAQVKSR